MDSELQRLRYRVRQLESELRALRAVPRQEDLAEPLRSGHDALTSFVPARVRAESRETVGR